jgi:hypothetical protein
LTADNYGELFQKTQANFGDRLVQFGVARARFTNAGFGLQTSFLDWFLSDAGLLKHPQHLPVFLAGDSWKKTYLVLEHVAYPEIDDNWRYALNAANLRFEFNDPEAAYQILSSRRPANMQTKK